MRRAAKVKVAAARIPVRKAAAVAAAARRGYPAWIEAGERGVALLAPTVTPRVRDALVLRAVSKQKHPAARHPHHGAGAR